MATDKHRREFKPFDSAPRDGTPFSVASPARFNPVTGKFEMLFTYPDSDDPDPHWVPVKRRSTLWCRALPLRYDPPTEFGNDNEERLIVARAEPKWEPVSLGGYRLVRRRTLLERITDYFKSLVSVSA